MKRFIVAVLVLVMGLSLVACGGSKFTVEEVVFLENVSTGGYVPAFYGSFGDEPAEVCMIDFANTDGDIEIDWDATDEGFATESEYIDGSTYQALQSELPLIINYEGKDYLMLVSSGTTFAYDNATGDEARLIFNPSDAEIYEG